MQPQRQFKIESYEIANNEISVMTEKNYIAIPVTIPLDKFEWWLRVEDKLQWVIDTSDHTGEHQQFTGTMSLEEYWNTSDIDIHNDLYEYIFSNPILTIDGVIYSTGLDSLLFSFTLHNAKRVLPRWEHEQSID